ncbi:MAG: caspase family protein [Nitrospirae bacterium]|nr:caspase family protein [Nitrospirota bacterium]
MSFHKTHTILFLSILLLSNMLISQWVWAGSDKSPCKLAQDLSKEASGFMESSDYNSAEIKLRKAVKVCSESVPLHYNLGIVLYYQKKYADAEKEIKRFIEDNPNNAKALNALAMVYIKSGKYDEALNLAGRATALENRNEQYKDTLRQAYAKKNPPQLSLNAFVKYPGNSDSTAIEGGETADLIVTVNNTGNGEAIINNVSPQFVATMPGLVHIDGPEKTSGPVGPNSKEDFIFKIQTDNKLSDGAVNIRVTAIEKSEFEIKPTTITLNTLSNVDTPPVTSVRRPDAVAVVIGNKDYVGNSSIDPVKYAEHDAKTIKEYLIKTLGFKEDNVKLLINAKANDLRYHFGDGSNHKGELYKRAKRGADIFIYYSGHGGPDTNTKKPYLLTADADTSTLEFTSYPLDWLYSNIGKLNKEKGPSNIFLVIDSCFSGEYPGGNVIKGASPIHIDVDMPQMKMGDNTVILASSKGDQISTWYDEKQHGLFTYFFLKAIKESVRNLETGKDVTIADVGENLPESVKNAAMRVNKKEQEPDIDGNKDIVLLKASGK